MKKKRRSGLLEAHPEGRERNFESRRVRVFSDHHHHQLREGEREPEKQAKKNINRISFLSLSPAPRSSH
ncbi:hypothetical protein CEP51_014596 [Fusarium floridanum]|uniref:Uncharacterized protein n=2 Tax=Fusarium solani species complex TaxID=232080 RepID=A0A428PPP2_9HYPO|nr:hypothetical protein CEP51_014596 [Fusarium floridanum]RSM20795.1 hypothetical protein CDV31_000485 [Fusarium ambrosium]